jgi:molybdenum cofactor synthesis domain-containing protein
MNKQPTAAFVIIGNEILSGRTDDTNLNYLATSLAEIGVYLREVRVVADIEADIIKAVNDLRAENDYVFTSGGIGPTHDDITSESIAKAFGVELELNDDAFQRLLKKTENPEDMDKNRKKMAHVPAGSILIDNVISAAPGFQLENVYVLAGVPVIFIAMVDFLKPNLKGGAPTLSVSVTTNLGEGKIAGILGKIQDANPDVDIGSYPHIKGGKLGVSLVTRGIDKAKIDSAREQICHAIEELGGEYFDE